MIEGLATRASETAVAPLAVGNAAKLYCLQRIEAMVRERDTFRIVDLGAGTAANFVPLLHRYPQIEYVGVDPSPVACALAQDALAGCRARIVEARAYTGDFGPADVVASFSVLEHVARRREYLRLVAATLAPDGLAFVNYDSGHFRRPMLRDRAKNLVGPQLARFGVERYYQSFVHEQEFRALLTDVGLRVLEARSFNTSLKDLYKVIPQANRNEFMEEWLRHELALDRVCSPYRDEDARHFRTRNFVLAPQP